MWCDTLQDESSLLLGAVVCLALLVLPAVLLSLGRDVRGPLAFTWAATSVLAPVSRIVLDDPLWLPVAVVAGTAFGLVVAAVEHGRRRATFALMGRSAGRGGSPSR